MNRVLLIIALIFGFASVGGASAHAALPGSASGLAVASGSAEALDLCPAAEMQVKSVAVFKPCGKKAKNGLAIFCDHQQAVLPRLVECSPSVLGVAEAAWVSTGIGTSLGDRQFRPPRLPGLTA